MQIQPASFAFTLLLGFLAAVPYSGIDINLPALAATGATLGVSPSEVGLTMSAFMLSLAVAPLVYGPVSDRLGRKPVVAFGIALFVVASLACALAQSLPELLICRFVQGIGAASTAMTFAIVRDLFGETTARTKIANVVVTHMGVFGSSGQVHRHIKKLRLLFRYPRSEPYFMTWLVPHQIKLTSGRRSKQLHQYPAFGGWGSGGRDHSFTRLFKPVLCSVPIAWIRQDRLGPGDWGDCVGASALRWSSSRRPR
jgi:hypothetical protein